MGNLLSLETHEIPETPVKEDLIFGNRPFENENERIFDEAQITTEIIDFICREWDGKFVYETIIPCQSDWVYGFTIKANGTEIPIDQDIELNIGGAIMCGPNRVLKCSYNEFRCMFNDNKYAIPKGDMAYHLVSIVFISNVKYSNCVLNYVSYKDSSMTGTGTHKLLFPRDNGWMTTFNSFTEIDKINLIKELNGHIYTNILLVTGGVAGLLYSN